ncbi:MAG: hypothetical protein HC923_05225 [Myxococcales bacterium]|nr:hypothetical protein [Myxococcales bacterium]
MQESPHASIGESKVESWRRVGSGRDYPEAIWALEVRVPEAWAFAPRDLSDLPVVLPALQALAVASAEVEVKRLRWADEPVSSAEAKSLLGAVGVATDEDIHANVLLRSLMSTSVREAPLELFQRALHSLLDRVRVDLGPVERTWSPTRLGQEHQILGKDLVLGDKQQVAGAGLRVRAEIPEELLDRQPGLEHLIHQLGDIVLPAEVELELVWIRTPTVVLGVAALGSAYLGHPITVDEETTS